MESKTFIIIKIILLILIAGLLTGILLILLNGNVKVPNYFNNKSEVILDKYYSIEKVNNIKINTSSADIKIINTDDTNARVVAYGDKNSKADVISNNNTLNIDFDNNSFCIGFCFYSNKLTIYVPKNYNHEFNINTKSGTITSEDFDKANFNIRTISGDITLGNLNNLNVISTSGEVISNKTNKTNIETTSGDILIKSSKDSRIKTTSGEIVIDNISNMLDFRSISGDIRIEKLTLNKNSKISTTSGDVNINETNDIYVTSKTTSGDSHIDKTNRYSKVELKIDTTSGDIYVK